MVGGNESIRRDVPPFSAVKYGGLKGYNAIGCKRSGMSRESIHALRAAFLRLHTHRTHRRRPSRAIRAEVPDVPEVRELLEFIAASKRGIQPSVRFLAHGRWAEETG